MLDPRIYRSAFLPLAIALVVAAFALQAGPKPLGTTLAPDAFDGARAARTLDDLAARFPDRRPGSPGDDALASLVAARFRAPGGFTVTTRSFGARTIDGGRTLRTVAAERPGVADRRIVVLASRDAPAARGTRAGLSATAGLLELAHVLGGRATAHTIELVSTSGGSGGAAGVAEWATHVGGPVDAVIVLGDLGGADIRRPWVVGWSDGPRQASLRLQATARQAVAQEVGAGAGPPSAAEQFLRMAFPFTVSEQGPLLAAGLPAVLVGPGGELGARPGETVDPARLRAFGRAVLRTVTALDAAPDVGGAGTGALVVHGLVLPRWAVRLLVGALLLPALLGALDAFFRARRRRTAAGRGVGWAAAGALPLLVAAALLWLLRVVGLLDRAPADPVPPGAEPVGWVVLGFTLAVLAAAWLTARRAAVRALRPTADGAGAGLALLVVLVACAVWLRNAYAAAFLVLPAHLWLLAATTEAGRRPRALVALVAAGLAPLALGALGYALALRAEPLQAGWIALLAVAGGHVGVLGVLGGSLVLGAAASALALAVRPPTGPPGWPARSRVARAAAAPGAPGARLPRPATRLEPAGRR